MEKPSPEKLCKLVELIVRKCNERVKTPKHAIRTIGKRPDRSLELWRQIASSLAAESVEKAKKMHLEAAKGQLQTDEVHWRHIIRSALRLNKVETEKILKDP